MRASPSGDPLPSEILPCSAGLAAPPTCDHHRPSRPTRPCVCRRNGETIVEAALQDSRSPGVRTAGVMLGPPCARWPRHVQGVSSRSKETSACRDGLWIKESKYIRVWEQCVLRREGRAPCKGHRGRQAVPGGSPMGQDRGDLGGAGASGLAWRGEEPSARGPALTVHLLAGGLLPGERGLGPLPGVERPAQLLGELGCDGGICRGFTTPADGHSGYTCQDLQSRDHILISA